MTTVSSVVNAWVVECDGYQLKSVVFGDQESAVRFCEAWNTSEPDFPRFVPVKRALVSAGEFA